MGDEYTPIHCGNCEHQGMSVLEQPCCNCDGSCCEWKPEQQQPLGKKLLYVDLDDASEEDFLAEIRRRFLGK